MTLNRFNWLRFVCGLAVAMLVSQSLFAEVLDKSVTLHGMQVHYKVVLPNGFDAAKTYPAILAFPGGAQTMDTVEGTLQRNWREMAERLGYIVVIPAAPGGQVYFQEGADVFPDFLVKLLGDYKILGNKFHIAGVSNGGLSAFHIAALYPQYFWSVTGLPGFLPDDTSAHMRQLAKLCINMYAGERDPDWLMEEEEQAQDFRQRGYSVEFSEENGQPHRMQTLEGDGAKRLFDQFERARKGCGR
jgi:dipeptidyl aminopeptidase/acylaminoacyl peptidase